MPMNPAAPESVPPITKPIAVSALRRTIRSTASTTATPAMIVYWRVRYAFAPSCTAAEISCIRSLPGERASSLCVTRPP